MIGIIAATVFGAILLFTALIVHSYIPSDDQLSQLASTAIVIQPESDVNVLNFSQSYTTAHVQVSGAVGIDAYQALGIQPQDQSHSHGAGWWESLREVVARRAIHAAGPLVLHLPQAVTIFPRGSSRPLLNVTIADLIHIPLIVRDTTSPLIDSKDIRLDRFTYEIRVDLLSPKRLATLATKAWARGSIEVDIFIPQVMVQSPSQTGWRKWLKAEQRDIRVTQKLDGKSRSLTSWRNTFRMPSPTVVPFSALFNPGRHQTPLQFLDIKLRKQGSSSFLSSSPRCSGSAEAGRRSRKIHQARVVRVPHQ